MLATGGGLVFSGGTNDRRLHAFDASTGQLRCEFPRTRAFWPRLAVPLNHQEPVCRNAEGGVIMKPCPEAEQLWACGPFWSEGRPCGGLAAYGADGVRSVLRMLQTELARDMAICGTMTTAEIDRDLVAIHRR